MNLLPTARLAFWLAVTSLHAVGAAAQLLSDSDVQGAIAAGVSGRFGTLVSRCRAAPAGSTSFARMLSAEAQRGTYRLTISSNAGRIALLAANAKRLYQPFDQSHVPPELLTDAIVFVDAEPTRTERVGEQLSVPAPIERIVLTSTAAPATVAQPTEMTREPVEWRTLLSGPADVHRVTARFTLDAVRTLPRGDLYLVLVTPQGERRCTLSAKDRAQLTAAR